MARVTTVERAFELARNGTCRSIADIQRTLKREGYANANMHLESGALKKQLRALLRPDS